MRQFYASLRQAIAPEDCARKLRPTSERCRGRLAAWAVEWLQQHGPLHEEEACSFMGPLQAPPGPLQPASLTGLTAGSRSTTNAFPL